MRPVCALLIPGLLHLAPAPAVGDSTMEQVIVTGTRLADDRARLSSSVSVIDLDEIEARNDANVADLLRAVPGLQVTQPGGPGGVASLYLRGGEANFTVFMIDGIEVNDPNNTRGGSFDLATLSLDAVERVEIVRGPQSAIYGSDALSGVVNVITRGGGEQYAAAVEAELGGDEYRRGAATVTGPVGGGGDFALQVSTRDDGDPVEGSHFDLDAITGKLRLGSPGPVRLGLYARYADSNARSFPEDSGGPELAVLRTVDRKSAEDKSIGADGDWQIAETWSLSAAASYYDRSDSFLSPGVAPGVRDGVPPNGADADLERTKATLLGTWRPRSSLAATLGIDFEREDGQSDGFVEFAPGTVVPTAFDLDRDTVGLFGELRFATNAGWILQGSLRRDDPDGSSDEVTSKLGAVLPLFDGATQLRANWGKGFKLPSFFALGSSLVGNPDLLPEKSESVDVGLRQTLAGGQLVADVTVFYNDFTDLIDFDPDLFINVNRSSVETAGVELQLDYAATDRLNVGGHVTYTDIDVEDGDTQLRQRPDWRGGANLQWQATDAWRLRVDWLYVDETFDSAIPTGGVTLSGYHRVDANLSWEATPKLSLAFAVDNLLDEDYEEAVGFPAVGLRARLAARYRFGG